MTHTHTHTHLPSYSLLTNKLRHWLPSLYLNLYRFGSAVWNYLQPAFLTDTRANTHANIFVQNNCKNVMFTCRDHVQLSGKTTVTASDQHKPTQTHTHTHTALPQLWGAQSLTTPSVDSWQYINLLCLSGVLLKNTHPHTRVNAPV